MNVRSRNEWVGGRVSPTTKKKTGTVPKEKTSKNVCVKVAVTVSGGKMKKMNVGKDY